MAAVRTTSIALAVVILSAAMVVAQAATAGGKNDDDGIGNEKQPKATDLVVEVCKNFSNGFLMSKVHFDMEPCVSVLHSDNRSVVAKDHGDLVMVALDLLERRSNQVAAKIDSMILSLPGDNWTKRAFQLCAADYADMLRTLPVCRDMFLDVKSLGKKAKQDAMAAIWCIDKMGKVARDCIWELSEHWHYDQLEEFSEVRKHISLAWGLMEVATNYNDINYNW